MFGNGVNLGSAYGSIVIGTGDISSALGNAKNMLRAGFADMSGMAKSWGGDLIKSGAQLGMATAPFSIALAAATKDMLSFDETMTEAGAILGKSREQMADVRDTVLDMSGKSVAGAQSMSEAYLMVVSAVQDTTQHMEILRQAQILAESGNADLEGSVKVLISAMNTYGHDGLKMSEVTDIIAQSVKLGEENTDAYTAALTPIIGLARQAGVSFKELAGATTFLDVQGATVPQAAIRVQAAIISLMKPNTTMTKIMHGLGFESGEAMIKQYGLVGSLEKLKESADKSGENWSKALGNQRAMQASAVLLSDEWENFNDTYTNTMDNVAETSRAVQMTGGVEQIKLLQSQMTELGIRLAETLLPSIISLVQQIRPIIDMVLEWIQANPALTGQIMMVTAAVLALAPAMMTAGAALNLIQGLLVFLMSPIGLIIAAVVALALAFQTNFMGIRDFLEPILERVRIAFEMIKMGIENFFSVLASGGDVVETIRQFLGFLVEQIVIAVTGSTEQGNKFREVFDTAFKGVVNIVQQVWPQIEYVFQQISYIITAYVLPTLGTLLEWFVTKGLPLIVNLLNWFVNTIWTPLFNVIAKVWEVVKPSLNSFFNWFNAPDGGWNMIATAIDNFVGLMWTPFVTEVGKIWEKISGALISMLNWFTLPSGGWAGIKSHIKDFLDKYWTPFANEVKRVWDNLAPSLSNFATQFKNTLQPVFNFVGDLINKIQTFLGLFDRWLGAKAQLDQARGVGFNPETGIDNGFAMPNPSPRASGGNTKPFATYRINENGMEYLTMGSGSGNIGLRPNGGGNGAGGFNFSAGSIVINANSYEGGKAAAKGFTDEFMEKYRSRG